MDKDTGAKEDLRSSDAIEIRVEIEFFDLNEKLAPGAEREKNGHLPSVAMPAFHP